MIARAVDAGIARILVPGYDLASSRAAVALAEAHPELIDAAVGVHPHFSAAPTAADWDELTALAAEPRVVAVGEIGLDFHRDLSPREAQRAALPVSFSSARGPRAAAAALADGTYLVETDSPWLAPGGGEQRNEPTTALRVAAELARLRGTSTAAIASEVAATYQRLVAAHS